MSDIMTWEELENSGELEGYEWYSNHIDAEVAAEIPCENCNGKCLYRGRKNFRTGSYRAFSECEKCGRVIEF